MKPYVKLNNDVLQRYRATGDIARHVDEEALQQYLQHEIAPRYRTYTTPVERLNALVEEGYYERDFLMQYTPEFIASLYEQAKGYNFQFETFMSASKF